MDEQSDGSTEEAVIGAETRESKTEKLVVK